MGPQRYGQADGGTTTHEATWHMEIIGHVHNTHEPLEGDGGATHTTSMDPRPDRL